MQASHESHALEVQTLQAQMHQLQDVVASSSVGNIQRLQEVRKLIYKLNTKNMHYVSWISTCSTYTKCKCYRSDLTCLPVLQRHTFTLYAHVTSPFLSLSFSLYHLLIITILPFWTVFTPYHSPFFSFSTLLPPSLHSPS